MFNFKNPFDIFNKIIHEEQTKTPAARIGLKLGGRSRTVFDFEERMATAAGINPEAFPFARKLSKSPDHSARGDKKRILRREAKELIKRGLTVLEWHKLPEEVRMSIYGTEKGTRPFTPKWYFNT